MDPTKYIWQNNRLIPWVQANVHVLSHALHYGSGVFEGIRIYQTATGPAIFKLPEHVKRLFYSANILGMEIPFSEQEIIQACIDLIASNDIPHGYIRPLVYYGYGPIKILPDDSLPVEVAIACWPWGDYLAAKEVDVKISDFIRIHPKSTVADAKICGHYINSLLAGLAIKDSKYHETLLLDSDGYVAEASSSNIFIVKGNQLITPLTGTILDGITRKTIIEIANYYKIPVTETLFKPEAITNADEAFFCGTAVEVTAIRSLDDQLIGNGKAGPITQQIQTMFQQIVHGEHKDFQHTLTWV
jgi:branched-chain amino acid aminotransferase